MSECNRQPIKFSNVGSRQIVVDFDGGTITSDGGALLLREVDRHLGLIDRFNAAIPDPRDLSRVNPRYIVTNLPAQTHPMQALYETTYCGRGECENRIKEQQLDLFAGRTSCHEFMANQFRVLLSAAAYVLIDHLRRLGLAGTPMQQAQAGSIRLKLLKIGARVVHSVRRVVLHLSSGYPLRELFLSVARRLAALPDWLVASPVSTTTPRTATQ